MVAEPTDIPVTMPELVIVATPALLVAQNPPETLEEREAAIPVQMVVVPDMVPALAVLFTFMVVVAVAVPQLLVTV